MSNTPTVTAVSGPDNFTTFTVRYDPPARIESGTPQAYRLARKPDGELVLQGMFTWSDGVMSGADWRDVETVEWSAS